MTITVYAHEAGPVSRAFLQVVNLINDDLVETNDRASADLILLSDTTSLRACYNDTEWFCVLQWPGSHKVSANQPHNVCILTRPDFAGELFSSNSAFARFLTRVRNRVAVRTEMLTVEAIRQKYPDVIDFSDRYSVLVIDDTQENLRIAEALLCGHSVTTSTNLKDAVALMDRRQYHAVLTDMEMVPDSLYSALNIDVYGVAETVPYGFATILEATERGMPVAVVTDGNHHQGWVSAMFDVKRKATVNGQKVLFFNNIGKRWDKALKALLEEVG